MAIKISCACGKTLSVKDEHAGKTLKCPGCQKPLRVPKPKVEAEPVEDDWDLGDSAEEDFDDEPTEAPAKSRGEKSSASRGAVSRKSSGKGKGKKSKSSNRGLLIGLSAGGGVLVIALLAWLLWPAAPAANIAGNPPANQDPTSAPASGDTAKATNLDPQVMDARQPPLTLNGHSLTVVSVAFSPDGKRLASGSSDQTVKVWDIASGQETLTFKGHTKPVVCVAFSPDGKRLASAGGDATVRLWDAMSGQETLTFKGHTAPIDSIAFSLDGKRLASASFDKTVKLWDTTNGQETLTLNGHTEMVLGVAFSPDGKRLASASRDQAVKLWDTTSGQEILTLKGHALGVTSVAFSPDGTRLASASFDQTVEAWDATSGQEQLTLKGHTDFVRCVAFSPNGKRLASAGFDQTVKVWDAMSGQETLTLQEDSRQVHSVSFSPDGNRLASASGKAVKLWDVSNRANSTSTSPSVPANATATDAGNDLKALQGDWHIVDFQQDPPAPPNVLAGLKLATVTFAGDSMTIDHGSAVPGGRKETGTIKLDASQTPKTIDTTNADGPQKGETSLGIYSLEGDVLKLHLGKSRPTSWTLIKERKSTVMVLNRGRPAVPTATDLPKNAFDHVAWKDIEPKLKAKGIQTQLMEHRGDPDATPDSPTHSALVDLPVRQANGGILDDLMQLLTPISHLAIRSTSMSDVGLKQLSECPGLTAVAVNDRWSVTPKGLVELMKCRKLRALYLNNTSISFDHLTAIKELTALRVLQINLMPLSPEMLAVIGDKNLLLALSLQKSKLTDEGLLQIAKLTKLKSLLLDDNPITDQGLQHLKSLPDLKLLSLRRLNVAPQAVDELQKALPNCQILK